MNSHKLNIESHSHIIGRKDGVTGDTIKANDEVIFCAACQSAFLRESWEYMNLTHCNQTKILDFVPQPIPTFFAKKREKFSFELASESSSETVQIIITTLLGTTLMVGFSKVFESNYFYIYTACALFLSILGGFLVKTKNFKEAFGNSYSKVKILENGIELKGRDFYSFFEIDTIEYVNKFESIQKKEASILEEYRVPPNTSLYLFMKDKRIIRHKLPKKSYPEIKNFLFALAHSTQFVNLSFYTEDKKERKIAKDIKQKYTSNILLLKQPTERDI